MTEGQVKFATLLNIEIKGLDNIALIVARDLESGVKNVYIGKSEGKTEEERILKVMTLGAKITAEKFEEIATYIREVE